MKFDEPNIFSHDEKYDKLFIKVPDNLIFDNRTDKFILVIYSWLDFAKDYYNFSHIDIGKLFECYYNELPNRKPNLYERIIDTLSYLEENGYLIYNKKNVNDFKYSNVSLSYISASLTSKFEPKTDFTIFYYKDFKKIMLNSKPKTLDLNLLIFLYVCSFMNFGHDEEPRVFYKSMENASKELGIRRCTIGDALTFLSSDECGVLKRCETFLTQPNIYVLNDDTADAEIKKALARLDVNVMPKEQRFENEEINKEKTSSSNRAEKSVNKSPPKTLGIFEADKDQDEKISKYNDRKYGWENEDKDLYEKEDKNISSYKENIISDEEEIDVDFDDLI